MPLYNPTTKPAVDARFTDLNSTQTIGTTKQLLKIDGLSSSTFNNFGYPIWDAANSKIIASTIGEKFVARLKFESVLTAPTVIFIDFTTGGTLIERMTIQPPDMTLQPNTETFLFFAREAFLQDGGVLSVSATNIATISKASLYLVKLAA